MYYGYWISLETKECEEASRFVTPAALADSIREMVVYQQDTDPLDSFQICVEWGSSHFKPDYVAVKKKREFMP